MRPAPVPAAIYDGIGLYLRGKVCTEPDGFCPSILETTALESGLFLVIRVCGGVVASLPGHPLPGVRHEGKGGRLRAAFLFLQSIQGKLGLPEGARWASKPQTMTARIRTPGPLVRDGRKVRDKSGDIAVRPESPTRFGNASFHAVVSASYDICRGNYRPIPYPSGTVFVSIKAPSAGTHVQGRQLAHQQDSFRCCAHRGASHMGAFSSVWHLADVVSAGAIPADEEVASAVVADAAANLLRPAPDHLGVVRH
jgi:hypothetical protein